MCSYTLCPGSPMYSVIICYYLYYKIIGSSRNERGCWPAWTTRAIGKSTLRQDNVILHYSWCSLAAGQLSLTSLGIRGSSHTSLHSFENIVSLHLEIWNVGNSKPFKTAKVKKQLFLVKPNVLLDSCECTMTDHWIRKNTLIIPQEGLSSSDHLQLNIFLK